ncbi:hypothetical protein B0A48_00677 [Cryoendolithus antarcticus]|uniref:Alpha/beta hydrolase fold-3 domain-containing protein n=1 Tax=Cryoendolithus antarcticus TaxID=1507870 RepID=A0A1V8TVG2_9PEZI|nr:hypothetical protein B0A48_00677 [Cryoendolithus antarcticus]
MSTVERKKVNGSCHCGFIRYTAVIKINPETGDIRPANRCNCSFCRKMSTTNHHLDGPQDFELISPGSADECGVHVWMHGYYEYEGTKHELNVINLATIDQPQEGVDLSKVKPTYSNMLVGQPGPPGDVPFEHGMTFPPGSFKLPIPSSARKRATVTERKVCDIYCYDIVAKSSVSKAIRNGDRRPKGPKRVYYFAGGGWRAPPSGEHWGLVVELAKRCPDTTVTLVSYPLAPATPAPMAFPMLQKLYAAVLGESKRAGETVILAGDSAGGNIVLALALAAVIQQGEPIEKAHISLSEPLLPDAILAISPSTDLRRTNPDISAIAPHDPILRIPFIKETAAGWAGNWSTSDSLLSPLLAPDWAFTALADRGVQIHGLTAGYDILCPDAVLFREKCEKAGMQGAWLHWEKQMHVWPLTWKFWLPEAREAKQWMVGVLGRC